MLQASTNWLTANRKFEKQLIYRIVIGGYYRSFAQVPSNLVDSWIGADVDYPWVVSIDEHNKNINDLQGGADQETFNFTVQDHREAGNATGALTIDMGAGTVFEGSLVQVYVGFGSLSSMSDYLLYWQGYVDQVDSANANTEYYFQCSDVTSKLQQAVYLTGDNGGQTSSVNIKTLTGHPLDMMLDICLNQLRDPKSGQALDPKLIDIDKITAYRDGPFDGMEFLFHLSQAPAALDFIKNQILKPLGGYLWVTQGKLTVNFFYPLAAPSPVQTVGPHDWLSIPSAEQTEMVNTVQFQFDKPDGQGASGGDYASNNTQEYGPSVAKYGLYGEVNIASDGLRSALQGYLISWLVSYLIFGRYGFKNLTFNADASEGIMTLWLLEPGDIVYVTHPQIPDRQAGVMGITNKLFECLNKKTSFNDGLVTLTMIDASYLSKFGFAEITPDGEADYTSASSGDKLIYMWQSGANGKYSNGDPGKVLG